MSTFSAGLAACDGQDSSTFVSSETHALMLELAVVVSELRAVAKTAVRACCACFLLFYSGAFRPSLQIAIPL